MEEHICAFLSEAIKLSGRNLWIKTGRRFILLQYKYEENSPFVYTYARIENTTGDIYSQSGKKAVGNIFTSPFGGREFIDKYGVIVNRQKLKKRLEEVS